MGGRGGQDYFVRVYPVWQLLRPEIYCQKELRGLDKEYYCISYDYEEVSPTKEPKTLHNSERWGSGGGVWGLMLGWVLRK